MECFPVCKVCNGLCKREVVKQPAQRKAPNRISRAQNAAIEKSRSGYLILQCGCITTYQDQIIIDFLFLPSGTKRPKGRNGKLKYWCEKHGNWQFEQKADNKREYPAIPPF